MIPIVTMRRLYMYLLVILTFLTLTTVNAQTIDWKNIKNPVIQIKDWSVKDACMVFNERNSHWYIFFSTFYFDNGRERSHITAVRTKDFKTISEPLFIWDGQEEGWIGMCSPNITKIGNQFVLTYNSWGDKKNRPNQLFYAVSNNLEDWEKHIPLAKNITEGVRSIDAAIIQQDGKYFLLWKKNQTPQLSYSNRLSGNNWLNMGALPLGWFENAEFIKIKGHLYLVCTGAKHAQLIYKKNNASGDVWSYGSDWKLITQIEVEEEPFNTLERMNAGFLYDNTEADGYFYYIYAGRTEKESHLGRGDNTLGLARSKNLLDWSIP